MPESLSPVSLEGVAAVVEKAALVSLVGVAAGVETALVSLVWVAAVVDVVLGSALETQIICQ